MGPLNSTTAPTEDSEPGEVLRPGGQLSWQVREIGRTFVLRKVSRGWKVTELKGLKLLV